MPMPLPPPPDRLAEVAALSRQIGLSAAARSLGIPGSTVRSWKYRYPQAFGVSAGSAAPPPPAQVQRPPEAPRSAWVRKTYDHYLIISDLQIPFQAPRALEFCERVRREYSVPLENVLCAGDEVDQYWGSRYAKSPDATHTANSEIDESRRELFRWYAAFPEMRLCTSNHGMRWAKKAVEAEIPSQMLRSYQEVLRAPVGWRWADYWRIDAKHPFLIEHGDSGARGQAARRTRALFNGCSTAYGHLHSDAHVTPVNTKRGGMGQSVWNMCVGSLIDRQSYAFHYNKSDTFQPWLGVGVVIKDGTTPILCPYES